jgi:hypothetical protein
MENMREELQQELSKLSPRGRGRAYPKGLMGKVLSYTVARRRQGAKLVEVAAELGMKSNTLARWLGEKRPAASSKYEQRARERAALLCLSARAPVATWPKALSAHWHRLFRATWATSEDGRGLRELVRELRMDARDEGVREAIRRRVRD